MRQRCNRPRGAAEQGFWPLMWVLLVFLAPACSGPEETDGAVRSEANSESGTESPGSGSKNSDESSESGSEAPGRTEAAQEPPPAPKEEMGEPPRAEPSDFED